MIGLHIILLLTFKIHTFLNIFYVSLFVISSNSNFVVESRFGFLKVICCDGSSVKRVLFWNCCDNLVQWRESLIDVLCMCAWTRIFPVLQGDVGPVGPTGPQGIKGEQGDKGEKVNSDKYFTSCLHFFQFLHVVFYYSLMYELSKLLLL